ncbi:hypothetical protein Bca4012_066861 [Brassica carinata]
MDPAVTVDENQTNITIKRRPWWLNKFVIYDIVMSALLIALNVAIFLYIRHSKIHIAVPHKSQMVEVLFGFYCATFVYGVALWVFIFLQNIPEGFEGGIMGLSHVMAIGLLIIFIYSISPVYSLFLGIPSALWIFLRHTTSSYENALAQQETKCS